MAADRTAPGSAAPPAPSERSEASMAQSYIGASLKRVEDDVFLRGDGRYVDDLREPGLLHLVVVRSPYAHARILNVDASAALALPGVVGMLTLGDLDGATLEPPNGPPGAE